MAARVFFLIALYLPIGLFTAILLTKKLSRHEKALYGILPAFFTSLIAYTVGGFLLVTEGFLTGILSFLLLETVPLAACSLFFTLRLREYRRHTKSVPSHPEKPPIVSTMKMRRLLKDFSTNEKLSKNEQHEIAILLQNGYDPFELTHFYAIDLQGILAIGKAFEEHVQSLIPKRERSEDFEISSELRDLILRLLPIATPQSLACGEDLLWQENAIAALIRKSTGRRPSKNTVLRFLNDCGLLLGEENFALSKTPEGKRWEKKEYETIRMSALEKNAAIFWLYVTRAKGLPSTVIIAVNPDHPTVFGVYKEHSGLSDFLAKLTQITSQPIYAVLCFKTSHFKKFTAPPESVTLFPYGERADVPESSDYA